MTEDMDKPTRGVNLQAEWDAERCPVVNGIIFGDGRVRLMSVGWRGRPGDSLELSVRPAEWTTLNELAEVNPLQWTGIIPLCNCEVAARKLRIFGGEGGSGSEGFVAITNADNGEIAWIAFFNESNPFEAIEFVGEHVVAKTNLGTYWRFPLDFPENVPFSYGTAR